MEEINKERLGSRDASLYLYKVIGFLVCSWSKVNFDLSNIVIKIKPKIN